MSFWGGSTVRAVVLAMARHGIPREALLEAARLAMPVGAPDEVVSVAAWRRLWAAAARVAPDPALAARIGLSIRPTELGFSDYLVDSAPTLADALDTLLALFASLTSCVALRFEPSMRGDRSGGRLIVRAARGGQPLDEEFAAGVIAGRAGRASQRGEHPRVWLTRRGPRAAFSAAFGRAPLFGAAVTAVELDPTMLTRALPTADAPLHAILRGQAQALGLFRETPDVAWQVRRVLSAPGGLSMSVDEVARAVGLSRRTLARRLVEHGAVFRALRAAVAADQAQRLLANTSMSLVEVALAVGFADQSAFGRFFVRVTGESPARWRAAARREA